MDCGLLTCNIAYIVFRSHRFLDWVSGGEERLKQNTKQK